MKTVRVESLPQFYGEVSNLAVDGNWLYRGQADASWGLIPSIYRGIETLDPTYEIEDAEWVARLERDVYREFEKHSRPYGKAKNQWERLALAQHHGTPTRLLDWTRSASIGLYFALASVKPTASALWCLNSKDYPFPKFLGRTTKTHGHRAEVIRSISAKRRPSFFQQVSVPFVAGPSSVQNAQDSPDPISQLDQGFLLMLDPPRFDERIRAQEGLFTLYYSFDDYDLVWDVGAHLHEVERKIGKDLLLKIEIPESNRKEILSQLVRQENMNWHRLFPDLVGLGQWLTNNRDAGFAAEAAARKKQP